MPHTSPHPIPVGNTGRVYALHRGFALRQFKLDLHFDSGARFVGIVDAVSADQAEEIAASRLRENVDTILRGDTQPMPLSNSWSDTQVPIPDDVVNTAITRADAALHRSEAMAEDLADDTGITGADFDAYNARHGVIGRLTGQHCDTASDADEATFRAWMDRSNRISAWQLYRQAHEAAWARRGKAVPPAVTPGSALDDMATVLSHSRSAADHAGPATWPDMTATPVPLPRLQTRHRVLLAWSFALAIGSALWWAGVI